MAGHINDALYMILCKYQIGSILISWRTLSCKKVPHDKRCHEIVVLDKAAHDESQNIIAGAESIKEKIKELNANIRQLEETTSAMESNVMKA